jgi:hypothetical protein
VVFVGDHGGIDPLLGDPRPYGQASNPSSRAWGDPSVAVAVDRAADLRRQAEILTRISKTISNVDSVAALLRLAAEYQAMADEHERSIQKQQQIQPKAPDKK